MGNSDIAFCVLLFVRNFLSLYEVRKKKNLMIFFFISAFSNALNKRNQQHHRKSVIAK